jgi:uncharacterized membrane protein YccC
MKHPRFGLAVELVRRAARVDRAALQPLVALRPAVGLALPIAIGVAVGQPIAGVSIGTGALVAGSASINGSFEPPVLMVALASVVTGAATFVGSATGDVLWAHVVLVAFLGLAVGLAVPLGRVPSQVATLAAVAFIVFGRFPLDVPHALEQGGFVAVGGLVQTVLAAVLRGPGRFRGERAAVAATFDALATYARGIEFGAAPLSVGESAAEAEAVLTRSWAGPESEAYEAFRGLLTGARRMRLEFSALQEARGMLTDPQELDDWIVEAADAATRIAVAIRTGNEVRVELRDPPSSTWLAATAGSALGGQLRAAARLVDEQRVAQRGPLRVPRQVGEAWPTVRANLTLTSTAFRHAIRLAVVLPIAVLIARELAARRGYWIPLTTLLLLRPDFSATVTRGIARFGGTVIGVSLATLLADGLHPKGATLVVIIALLGYAAFATFRAAYGLYSTFVGALVVFLISVPDPQSAGIAADRLLDTTVGAVLAVLAYLLWPTWEGPRLEAQLATLVRSQGGYLSAVVRALGGATVGEGETTRRSDAVRAARTNVEASLERAEAEPRRFAGDVDIARDVLVQSRLAARAGHALDTVAEQAASVLGAVRIPGLLDFARAIDAASVRFGEPDFPDLRAAHDALGEGYDDASRAIIADIDRVVDAFDTIHGLYARAARHRPTS